MKRIVLVAGLFGALLLGACGDGELGTSSGGSGGAGAGTGASTSNGGGGSGGVATVGGGGSGGVGGTGGTGTTSSTDPDAVLNALLDALRADPQKALLAQANEGGWPADIGKGHLFVTTDSKLDKVAGDFDGWSGTALTQDQGFRWIVLQVSPGAQYKFTNLTDWLADPWSRAYTYDNFGQMSLVKPAQAHLERFFKIGDAQMEPRTVRILVPAGAPTHVIYTHDGQNLFDPEAFFGGWKIQESAPAGVMVVGIDNTPARMDEYTHVPDKISGQTLGGLGDAYADFLQDTVRPLVAKHYGGEPKVVGTMGSSLGGLISFHIADRYPGEYAFAASLSGTMGWGSIGNGVTNETMIERYASHGHQATVLYLDSGGDGGNCGDTDGDGIEDDIDQGDNYCENAQLFNVLEAVGYQDGNDLVYVWDPGASHNEAAWASRVSVPLQVFAGL
ncbi:MAG: alpha/beta hydrolase-fold protein [Polyangiaceae bacterium]